MASAGSEVPQTPSLTKYVDPLPIPATAIPDPFVYPGADYYDIAMRQGSWQFHRDLGPAKVWGYWATNPQDPPTADRHGLPRADRQHDQRSPDGR